MHYVELDDKGMLVGVFPLESEIAGTEFYDGILIPVAVDAKIAHCHAIQIPLPCNPNSTTIDAISDALAKEDVSEGVEPEACVQLLLLNGIPLTAAKFSTDNSCCNGHIQRL